MMCGNGSVATLHPSELFGADWESWGTHPQPPAGASDETVPVQRAVAGTEPPLEQ
jgi:hypothetical protein